MKLFNTRVSAFVVAISLSIGASAMDDVRLLRFPDIRGDLVTFVYAGDIWTVNSNGGEARRLTSHDGLELFPKISPDGQWIAFSGEYSGSRQVYVMPAKGGVPRQLTWYNSVGIMPPRGGYDNVVLDWTPDSKQILIRANRTPFGERRGRYFLVNMEGGTESPLPIISGGFGVLSPDGSNIVFTPVDREFRNWKRYKGGMASDLWIYNLKNNTAEQITDFAGTDHLPVWSGDDVYFASDRDLKLNIWKYNTVTKETRQITFHTDYDVMWPSGSDDRLVYENGGHIYRLDLQSGKSEKLAVSINFDNPGLIPYFKNVKENIHSVAVSPTGKRVLFDARGDIFSVPAEKGITENLTESQGVREIYPSWSPDGRYISYYSDRTGEYELYLLENLKGARPRQVTFNSAAWKYQPQWSPDSRYIAYSDRTLSLMILDVRTGEAREVDHATRREIRQCDFSPDGRWITYQKEGANDKSSVWVYEISSGKRQQVTGDTYSDNNPVFSMCGNYIFFSSDRDYNMMRSSFEFDYIYNRATRLYAVALTPDSPRLFKERNDAETVKAEPAPVPSASGRKEKQATPQASAPAGSGSPAVKVDIDFNAMDSRVTALPGEAGRYQIIGAVKEGLVYLSENSLKRFNTETEKVETIIDSVRNAVLTDDGNMVLYRAGNDFGIVKLAPGQKPGAGKLDLRGLEMKIDPRSEWNQIFNDAWRIFRDYFYVSNLHGVDWKGVKERYSKLLPSVSHRTDLDYIINEMVAESNTGHSYVEWGDFGKVKRIDNGLLGAEFEADGSTGRYRIKKIYSGENWNPSRRSPLTEQGVEVREGDYLIAIDGHQVTSENNLFSYLENKAGKPVEVTVNSKPSPDNARSYIVKPLSSELELLYLNWVNERRAMVDRLSGGRVGYIHVPNTEIVGNRELFHGMYTYFNKEALIIDDRYNGGGFIPDRMTDLLDRKTLVWWNRNGLEPSKSPAVAHDGPKVMLINGFSSSGGDAFPYFFKKMGLGTLIGTRTWGGLVGISGNAVFVDGGFLEVPQFGVFDREEGWIIEGIGVFPDIEVVDRPDQLASGTDPCIEKAVEVLLRQLDENPVRKVEVPSPPDRSKWHEDL